MGEHGMCSASDETRAAPRGIGMRNSILAILALVTSTWSAAPVRAGQPLETESARMGAPGTLKLEAGVERQRAPEGTEANVPLALEYQAARRLELLVEPVVYSNVRDPRRRLASGPGDLEVTALFLARAESRYAPATAVAVEIKLPTARSRLIGSGKADYTGYLILSKRFSPFDVHGNLGYAVIGRPAGVTTQNVYSFAIAGEWKRGRFDAVAEVLGNTAALGEGTGTTPSNGENQVAPEIGGEELVGTVGARYRIAEDLVLSMGVSYDNNRAVQVHPGLSLRLR